MTDFYRDVMDGTGTLTRTPDVGPTPTAPTIDVGDGTYVQSVSDLLLTAFVRDGAGALQKNNTVGVDTNRALIQLPIPPSADFFVEAVVNLAPNTDEFYLSIYARTSAEASNPPNGVNVIGPSFIGGNGVADRIHSYIYKSLEGVSGTSDFAQTAASYPAGPYDFTLRAEFDGNQIRRYVNGTPLASYTITDSAFLVAGQAMLFFEIFTYTGNLSEAKILSLRAGTYPDLGWSVFWTAFEKTHEEAN